MSNLRRIREVNWAEIEAEEARLLRQLTPQEGIRHFLEVQAMLEPQYRATETLFRPQREAHLTELQSRLARFQAARDKAMDMNKLIESVLDLQKRLDEAGIPSVLIGGLAVSAWGEPRGTRDVDLKVLLKREDAQRLLDLLGADFVPLHADPLQAIRRNGVLFVHNQLGVRIDLLLADTDFDEAAIRRGRSIELDLDRVALDFPELRIVGGHLGWPWHDEAIALAWKHANVWIDTSAHVPKHYPPEFVHFMKTFGKDKVCFATDYPLLQWERVLAEVDGLDLGPEVKQRFLHDNAVRAFNLKV